MSDMRENERLRAALKIARVMVADQLVAHAQYSNGRTLLQILDGALQKAVDSDERSERIAVLEAALRRIDGINDNPACYNAEINEVLDEVLRQGASAHG